MLRRTARATETTPEGGRLRQLARTDSTFVYLEGAETPMHLTTMYIYDQSTVEGGVFRHKDLLRLIASRLHTSPVFQERMVHVPFELDHPYWVHDPNGTSSSTSATSPCPSPRTGGSCASSPRAWTPDRWT